MEVSHPNQQVYSLASGEVTKTKTIKAMKREVVQNQTMSFDMEKMSVELAEKYCDAMAQKLIWQSSTQESKDMLAQKISVVSNNVSECYTSLTPKFFGFTFVCEDGNLYLEFLLDEEVPESVEKRHVLFSLEEFRENTKMLDLYLRGSCEGDENDATLSFNWRKNHAEPWYLYSNYVAAKIINKAKEVVKHDTLLKCGYIPVFLFFVGDKERYDYFYDIYYSLYDFVDVLERYYDAGYTYCVVSQNESVIASVKIVPYEPYPLSYNFRNLQVIDITIYECAYFEKGVLVPSGSLVAEAIFYKDYAGEVKDITYDILLNYIRGLVVRIKEICKALNRTFDAVRVRFGVSDDCLQSMEYLNELFEKSPYIGPEGTPPIFFSWAL
jgi:hypothetical protein